MITLPVVAPAGTGVTILVALQLDGVATIPLNVSVLLPWLAPKFEPLMLTVTPIGPGFGAIPVITGDGITVKLAPLLFTPLAFTITFPVAAPEGTLETTFVEIQLMIGATVPLNRTEPLPCDEPKFVPLMVTDAPAAPEVGEMLEMWGADTTVKFTPLLSTALA